VQDPDVQIQYEWHMNSTPLGNSGTQHQLINLQANDAGAYFVEATNDLGCSGQSNIIIIVPESIELFIPDVFTPNNDGINDYFHIVGLEFFEENELIIVNKRGKLVYSKKNYDNNWDGEGQPDDIYYYQLKVKTSGGATTTHKGYVYIKR
jgi:gliding motility-associated-like protein